MDTTTVEKLIKGVGVIIDNDAEEAGKPAEFLLSSIKSAGIPMVVYTDIPDISVIESFGNISFVILDWDFSTTVNLDQLPAEVVLGSEFRKEQKRTILEFLHELLINVFVPIFLITGQNFEEVKSELRDAGIYNEDKANRILLKTKTDISDYSSFIKSVAEWVERTPSVHVLKLWEGEAVEAKNKMFLDMYTASSNWVNVLLRIFREDSENNRKAINHDLAELLNNNFVNRISDTVDYSSVEVEEHTNDQNEIRRILQGERYITYNQEVLPDVCYVGDLYLMNDEADKYPFRLNIRAQCDTIREENPRLYLIPGRKLNIREISKQPGIRINEIEGNKTLCTEKQQYALKELLDKDDQTKRFNNEMRKYQRPLQYIYGDIIEKKTHSIISCVAEETLIEFCFREFEVSNKQDLETKGKRIGRLLPPYITKVQNSFSSFMIRTGIMPIPEELLDSN